MLLLERLQIKCRAVYATCMSGFAEEVHVCSVDRSQAETDLQPFRQEGMEPGAGSWRTGTKYALATGLTSLCVPWHASGGAEFRRHLKTVSSYNVRGRMCGLLERICHAALEEDAAGTCTATVLLCIARSLGAE